jgi:hypothetical protein
VPVYSVKYCGVKGMNIPPLKEIGTEIKVQTPCHSCSQTMTRQEMHIQHSKSGIFMFFNYLENHKSRAKCTGYKKCVSFPLQLLLQTFFTLTTTYLNTCVLST